MLRQWGPSAFLTAVGIFLAATAGPTGIAVLIALEILAFITTPLAFPRSLGAAEAQSRSAADGHPIIYWRPGCPFCLKLRACLGYAATKAHWVNIWQDPAGAAAVRAVADGNETVPTVFLGGTAFVNPDPAWLKRNLK
jgi:mycoredoxin